MRGQPYLTKLQGRPNWYIEWYDAATGRNRRRSTGHKIGEGDERANRALAAAVLELDTPTAKNPNEYLVAQVLEDYWKEHAEHLPTAQTALKYAERAVKREFGNLVVSQLIPAKIEAYIRKCRKENKSNDTVRKYLSYLQAALNHAIENDRITSARKIKMPSPAPAREKILSIEEIDLVISKCKSQHVKDSIFLMFNTGQRPGAIASLTWFQVNFETRIIHFERVSKESGELKEQNNKRTRPVVMNEETYNLLVELYNKRETEYVIEYIIRNKKGEIVSARPAGNIKKALMRAYIDAGLLPAKVEDRKKLGRGQRPNRYTLRHTFANHWDGDEKVRSDVMGHTKIATTNNHYVKVNKGKQLVALNALPKLRTNYAQADLAILETAKKVAEILGGA